MSKEGLAAIRIFMPSELRDSFKTICAVQKSTMNRVVVELVEGYVEHHSDLLPSQANGKAAQALPSTFKELVRQNYFELMNAGKIGHQRLKELSYGQKATPKERQQVAQTLGLDEGELPDD